VIYGVGIELRARAPISLIGNAVVLQGLGKARGSADL